jgi:hypothetical protein
MGQDQGQVGAAVDSGQKSPEQIRREIEETREDLGETAAALAAKTDVKTRAKEKVEGVRAGAAMTQVKASAQQNPIPTAAIAAFVGGYVLGRITSR